MRLLAVLSIFFFALSANASPWFTLNSETYIPSGWSVTMQTGLPANAKVSYKFFPLTQACGHDVAAAAASTWTGPATFCAMLWINKYCCGHGNAPNNNPISPTILVNGTQCYARFTRSAAEASTASAVQASHVSGLAAHRQDGLGYNDIAVAGGFSENDVIPYAVFAANPAAYCTDSSSGQLTVDDKIILLNGTLSAIQVLHVNGLMMDYERHDGASGAETLGLVTKIALLVRTANPQWKVQLYTNPMDGNAFPFNGIFPVGNPQWNTDAILTAVDTFGIFAYSQNSVGTVSQEVAAEEAMFQNFVPGKADLAWDLRNSPADAAAMYSFAASQGFHGVIFWLNGTANGSSSCSDLVNQQIGSLSGVGVCGNH